MEHRFQHRNQIALADGFQAAHHLPLRHCVDRVEVIHAQLAFVLTLMHRIDSEITRPPFRVWFAALADRDLASLRVVHSHPQLAVSRRLPQIVDMRRRDLRQPPEFLIPIQLERPRQQQEEKGVSSQQISTMECLA